MNPKNILKVAKNWHFKNQNKPIRPHRQICLSKITLRALIGQKQNKGDSCFSCPISVSSNHNSKQRHAVKSNCRKIKSKPASKCVSLQNTEVSHKSKFPVKIRKLRHQYLNSTGQKSTHPLKTCDDKPSWLHPGTKVRNLTKVCYLITSKIIRLLKIEALTGYVMAKTNKNPEKGEEKSNERGHKDLSKKSKSSKKHESKTAKRGVINSEELKVQLAAATKNVKKRSSSKTLGNEEKRKHLSAVQSTMNKIPVKSKEKKKSHKAAPTIPQIEIPKTPERKKSHKAAPTTPQITAPKTPERIDTSDISPVKGTPFYKFTGSPSKKANVKRKRNANRIESEQESESSEPQERERKRAKKSRIQETTEEQSSSSEEIEDVVPGESPRARLRRIQALIWAGKTGSRETRTRLSNRSNTLFHQVIKEGRKITRRNPKVPFKARPKKPANGASISHHAPGKMLKAKKIMDKQYAGKLLRYYLNGFGYQLRLAEADRKMQELTLPELEPNKRVKAKGNRPARMEVDSRRRSTHKNLRRLKKALDALDQHLCPNIGAFPVEQDQSKIRYVCLMASDEEANVDAHPNG